MKIEWNDSNSGDPAGTNANLSTIPAQFTNGLNWTWPAVLEVGVVSYPTTAIFTASQSTPCNLTSLCFTESTVQPKSGLAGLPLTYPFSQKGPNGANCNVSSTSSNPYNCSVVLNNFAGQNYIIRMRPRYAQASYRIQFFDASGFLVKVPGQMATIDVTAKAGDVYRRIVVKIPVRSGVLQGLDYVLFSDKDICKDFKVAGGAVSGFCPPAS